MITLAASALVMGACGGGDSTETTAVAPTTTQAETGAGSQATTPPTTKAQTESPATTEAVQSPAAGTATAAIGDTKWSFAMSGDPRELCNPDIAGTFIVAMYGQDDSGGEIVLSVTSASGQPTVAQAGSPLVSEGMWIADESIYENFPDLDPGVHAEAEVSGNTISGTATFYEDRSLRETLQTGDPYETGLRQGTFSANC
jgi:hypothetical protein